MRPHSDQPVVAANALSHSFQRHYSVAEISEKWGLSRDAIRRLFRDEPGVLVLRRPRKDSKRPYTTLRIPQEVMERVYQRSLS